MQPTYGDYLRCDSSLSSHLISQTLKMSMITHIEVMRCLMVSTRGLTTVYASRIWTHICGFVWTDHTAGAKLKVSQTLK